MYRDTDSESVSKIILLFIYFFLLFHLAFKPYAGWGMEGKKAPLPIFPLQLLQT